MILDDNGIVNNCKSNIGNVSNLLLNFLNVFLLFYFNSNPCCDRVGCCGFGITKFNAINKITFFLKSEDGVI